MPERVLHLYSPKARLFFGSLITAIALSAMAGAVSIPFYYESSTIHYKFGSDRLLLRAGQVAGMAAGCLLVLQIISGARLRGLDRIFSLNRLYRIHRITGIVIACLVVTHPILIFIPENRFAIPLQWRYWPEFVGLFLVLLIMAVVITSNWRGRLGLGFQRWWLFHRGAAMLVVGALWVHVLSVSDTFAQKTPQMAAYGTLIICALLLLWLRIRPAWGRRQSLVVSEVKQAGSEAVCLKLVPDPHTHLPAYIAGQFGFLTVLSPHISTEEHPFSIASSPTRRSGLEFIVRTTGDWTSKLPDIQPGDRVLLDGPFGLFSHLGGVATQEIVMVAGGIGITPMLSMLRYMADQGDRRQITLLWSNRTREHIVFPEEFQALKAQLRRLRIHHILTRESEFEGEKGRLDRSKLKMLLADCSRSSAVFVCGPERMMKKIYAWLVSLEFPRRKIFMERFRL